MTRPQNPPPPGGTPALDDATRGLVRGKARQIARRAGFTASDLPDLEQDLCLHLWARLPRYDPAKGPPDRFVRMLLAHAVAAALRARRRLDRRAPASLDALLRRGPDGPPEHVDPRVPADPGLALDVAAVLSALPRPLRRVAEALKTRSVAAAARHLKVSRAALYRRLGDLRAVFVAAGLEQFGPARADTSSSGGVVPW